MTKHAANYSIYQDTQQVRSALKGFASSLGIPLRAYIKQAIDGYVQEPRIGIGAALAPHVLLMVTHDVHWRLGHDVAGHVALRRWVIEPLALSGHANVWVSIVGEHSQASISVA